MGKAQEEIIIKGLRQNNLKNISLNIPKEKIVVFTGVSGSGKSSIVFDTIAAESQRQMNETYTAFMRGRLPKYEKPKVAYIDNLTASVIIDQSRLGGNARSTVGTISDLYAAVRLLYSRIGTPYVGTASYFSFNNPNGMCMECSGIGKVMNIEIESKMDPEKSWNEGLADLPAFHVGNWYWKQYAQSGLIPLDKKYKDYTETERNILLYGAKERGGEQLSKKVEGIENYFNRILIKRSSAEVKEALVASLTRMIDIGLPYLSMNRESATLSGGEAQRLKLVRYMGSSLTGMTYIFDEPSTGMHPRDVHRMSKLLKSLRDKGNTVLVVEHDKDIISIADEVIDVGPLAGKDGGQILFQGSFESLLLSGTKTGNAMKEEIPVKMQPRIATEFLPVRNANLHNLKEISVDIPLNILSVITGVAGSGKSTLIRDVFAKQYEDRVVLVDQSPVTATGRSTPATFLGFFDEIRKLFASESGQDASMFSFNGGGACPVCKGRGMVVTELVFMDPVTTVCEECEGKRYSSEALRHTYHGKNIIEILNMSVEEAYEFFGDNKKISKKLKAMLEVGLPYLALGQPLSTLSGGERQRVKLAKDLDKKGNIYILDEPTTGLHASDIKSIMILLDSLVKRGNTVIVIEHNLDVMKQADYMIDIGPDGGSGGGEVVFAGTPKEMLESADTITARYLRKSMGRI